MANVKIKLNESGIRELLRSEETKNLCEKIADNTLNRLGDGYVTKTVMWPDRVTTTIHADSYEAKRENLKHNTILKALKG